jgi:ABC-2 type transport system permease protein
MIGNQARAILWAQGRSLWNRFPRTSKGGLAVTAVVSLFWYGLWVVAAVGGGMLMASPEERMVATYVLPAGLLLAMLYWQIIPVLMAATGASLDVKKLMVYPIPHAQLFSIEVLLRLTTGIEMLILLAGASIGILCNRELPIWAAGAFLPFILLNLFLAAGIRDLIARLLARKRLREAVVFVLVMLGALPQLLISTGISHRLRGFMGGESLLLWPWMATAQLAQGKAQPATLAVMAIWLAAAYWFGRRQFERGLSFDAAEGNATPAPRTGARGWGEAFFRLPARLFPDPMAAIVEKELRVLSRAPRFRLVFTMGFSFGLIVWLPLAFRRAEAGAGAFSSNYLTFVSLYALLLLGEVCFWNVFGFDRSAAQSYFAMPVRLQTVIAAKNVTAVFFVLLEITAIDVVCAALRMPFSWPKMAEAYSVTLVVTLYLVAVGNLTSMYNPRPVDPAKSLRSASAGRIQAFLVLVYPLASLPVMLAYLARYAFQKEAAFYGVLAFAAVLGAIVYWVSMESAVETAMARKEQILTMLSQGEGPIAN